MALASDMPKAGFRPSMLLYDTRYRSLTIQVVVLMLFMAGVAWLVDNTVRNLAALGKDFNYGFLWQRSGYDISQRLIEYSSDSTHGRAMLVGLLNTFLVSAIGCVVATVIGVIAGVLRLSKSWIVARLMTLYVEVFRNIPLLMWILLFYAVVTEAMPPPNAFRGDDAASSMILFDSVAITNRYTAVPDLLFSRSLGSLELGYVSLNINLVLLIAAVVGGVLANRVASVRHAAMLLDSMGPDLTGFGAVFSDPAATLPDRHLGLVQASEVTDLDARIDAMASKLSATGLATLPPAVLFASSPAPTLPLLLAGQRIAVARDTAFSFMYSANLDLLRALGAELRFFSPLADTALPEVDSLYLPGGYPELHLDRLQTNRAMDKSIRAHHAAGRPILAECGGMLYLLETLTDAEGQRAEMVGLLPGQAVMQPRLTALALQAVQLPEGELRGHTFHHSRLETK
ncbi:MAG: hypothetical protein AUK60_00395, partial [Rhodobacteraceae bacterium CG2_30_10_405]